MSTDKSELFRFNEFVLGKLQSDATDLTPEQCLELWRLMHPTEKQMDENVIAIQAAIDDMNKGIPGEPAIEIHSRLRTKYADVRKK